MSESKGLFQLEVIKDIKWFDWEAKKRKIVHKKGAIVWCYDVKWFVDMTRMNEVAGTEDEEDFLDKTLFLIWLSNSGWFWAESCHFKPVGAKLNKSGIC